MPPARWTYKKAFGAIETYLANQFLAPPHLHVLALSSTPFQAFSGPEDGVR
jgi:hypothetical protein